MSPDEQILGVVQVLQHARAVNPDGKPFKIVPEKLEPYPDHDAILNKLQDQHNAISIKQRPNARGLSSIDMDVMETMGEISEKDLQSYMSYYIQVLPKFDEFYDQLRGTPPSKGSDITFSVNQISLQPTSYDKHLGILYLSPVHKVVIAKRGSVKTKTGKEQFECRLMKYVFKSVKTLSKGASFSMILSLHDDKIHDTEKSKISNTVYAINEKVTGANGPKNLLKIQSGKVFVNNSYL